MKRIPNYRWNHFLVAALLTIPLGPIIPVALYGLREAYQAIKKPKPVKWSQHLHDWLFALCGATATTLYRIFIS